jgi:hypothetical protein
MKIKLPGRHILRVVAVFVGKGESNLDDLEQVHVTAHGLIVVVRGCFEAAYWTRDDTRKLGVLDGGMGAVRLVRGACVPRGGHTKETNGYLSMRSRMFRISWSRLGAHTSRMGDIYPNCCST